MIDAKRLAARLGEYDIVLTDEQYQQLDRYAEMLVEWNEKMNLTAITEPEEIEIKHFLDCLLAARMLKGGEKVIDVGTGAGFPGMVLKIACPDIELTLLDSLDKRLGFLQAVCREIGVKCRTVHARAEDGGHDAALRESFDAACARAVAPLNVLSEFCLPFVRVGGRFLAMKGSAAADELSEARNAFSELGGELLQTEHYTLPDGSEREILLIEKTASTPERYPRRAPAIKKKPL